MAMAAITRAFVLSDVLPRPTEALPLQSVLHHNYRIGRLKLVSANTITYWGWDEDRNTPCLIYEYYPAGRAYRPPNEKRVLQVGEDERSRVIHQLEKRKTLRHNNIIPVRLVMQERGTVYWVSSAPPSQTLQQHVDTTGAWSWEHTLEVLTPILDVIQRLHSQQVAFGRCAPDTIWLADADQRLLLNLGHLGGGTSDFFSAPEGEGVRVQGDVYGLSALWVYLLHPDHPTAGAPVSYVEDLPVDVARKNLLKLGLLGNPDQRHPNADAWLTALRNVDQVAAPFQPISPTIPISKPVAPAFQPVYESLPTAPVSGTPAYEQPIRIEGVPTTQPDFAGEQLPPAPAPVFAAPVSPPEPAKPRYRRWLIVGLVALTIAVIGLLFWQSDYMKQYRYDQAIREGEQLLQDNRISDAYLAFTSARENQDTPFVQDRIQMCKGFVDAVQAGNGYLQERWYAKASESFRAATALFPNAPEPQQKLAESEQYLQPLVEQARNFASTYIATHNDYSGNGLYDLFDEKVQYKGKQNGQNVNKIISRGEFVHFIRQQLERFSSYEYTLESDIRVEPSLNLNRYKVFFDMSFHGIGNTEKIYDFQVQKQLTLREINGQMRVTYDAGDLVYQNEYDPYSGFLGE